MPAGSVLHWAVVSAKSETLCTTRRNPPPWPPQLGLGGACPVWAQLRREMAAGINGRSSAVDNVGFAIGLARLLPEALGKRLALAWRAPSRYRAPEPGQQFLAPRAAKTRVRRRGMNRKRLIRETLAKIAIAAAGDGQRESLAHAQVVELAPSPTAL